MDIISSPHTDKNDTELISIPETDLLEDFVWAEKTFVTSPLGNIKVGELRSPAFSLQTLYW